VDDWLGDWLYIFVLEVYGEGGTHRFNDMTVTDIIVRVFDGVIGLIRYQQGVVVVVGVVVGELDGDELGENDDGLDIGDEAGGNEEGDEDGGDDNARATIRDLDTNWF